MPVMLAAASASPCDCTPPSVAALKPAARMAAKSVESNRYMPRVGLPAGGGGGGLGEGEGLATGDGDGDGDGEGDGDGDGGGEGGGDGHGGGGGGGGPVQTR